MASYEQSVKLIIYVLIAFIAVMICAILVVLWLGNRRGRKKDNPQADGNTENGEIGSSDHSHDEIKLRSETPPESSAQSPNKNTAQSYSASAVTAIERKVQKPNTDYKHHSHSNDTQRVDAQIRSLEQFRLDVCDELKSLYDRIARVAKVIMILEIVSISLWFIAYLGAGSLEPRVVAEILADDGIITGLYLWATSTSLPYVFVSIIVAIVSGCIYHHYKYRSLYVDALKYR